MSGLVSGLQNRVRRFESARNLKQSSETTYNKGFRSFLFFLGDRQIKGQTPDKFTFKQILKSRKYEADIQRRTTEEGYFYIGKSSG